MVSSPPVLMLFHSNSTVASVRKNTGQSRGENHKNMKWTGGAGVGGWCCFLLQDCVAALFLSCIRHSSHTTCGLHPCVFCPSSRVRAPLRRSNSLHLFRLPSHSNRKVTGAFKPPVVGKLHLFHPHRTSHYLFLIPEITPLPTTWGPHACHFEPH